MHRTRTRTPGHKAYSIAWTVGVFLVLASPLRAQVPVTVVNQTPDTLDVFAYLPPNTVYGIGTLAPGDSVSVPIPPLFVNEGRFALVIRPKGTERLLLVGTPYVGVPVYLRKERPRQTGTVGT